MGNPAPGAIGPADFWFSAISDQPSAISHQPSAISHQPSAISHQPSILLLTHPLSKFFLAPRRLHSGLIMQTC
jgi:hypothetical protein